MMAAVMLYAARYLGEGVLLARRGMRFGPRELDAPGAPNVVDLHPAAMAPPVSNAARTKA